MNDPNALIRSTAGTLITTIVSLGGLHSWPEVIPQLLQSLDSNDPYLLQGTFDALKKICEDSKEDLEDDSFFSVLDALILKLIQFFSHPLPKFRSLALHCANQFITNLSRAFKNHIEEYLQALFKLADDSSKEVVKLVCSAFVFLVEVQVEILLPHLPSIIEVSRIFFSIFPSLSSISYFGPKMKMRPLHWKLANSGYLFLMPLCAFKFLVAILIGLFQSL